jgi:hypothetical protein
MSSLDHGKGGSSLTYRVTTCTRMAAMAKKKKAKKAKKKS